MREMHHSQQQEQQESDDQGRERGPRSGGFASAGRPVPGDERPIAERLDMSRLEGYQWAAVVQAAQSLLSRLEAELSKACALTPFEFHLLALLERGRREVPMSRVASDMDSSLSRLSHVVRRLENRGLIARRTSREDGRVTLVRITDEGIGLHRDAADSYVAAARRLLLDRLGPPDAAELTRLNLVLLSAMTPSHWLLDPTGARALLEGAGPAAS